MIKNIDKKNYDDKKNHEKGKEFRLTQKYYCINTLPLKIKFKIEPQWTFMCFYVL